MARLTREEAKAQTLARKTARRHKLAPVTLDTDALLRELERIKA